MLNDYPPFFLCSINSILCFVQLFAYSYAYDRVFEERLSARKFIKIMISSIVYGVAMIVIYYVFEVGTQGFLIASGLYSVLLVSLILPLFYPARKKEVLFLEPALFVFHYLCSSLLDSIINESALSFGNTLFNIAIVHIVYYLLISLLMMLTFKILVKTKYIVYLKALLDFPKLCIFWLVSYFGMVIHDLFSEIGTKNYVMIMFGIAIVIFIVVLTTRDFLHNEKIKQNDALILQQGHYVKRLENIQQELKVIQHDYKNMISSLYAQASEGDSGSIKSFIETKLIGVDAAVQDNISQMNQVSNIEMSELKGLVLTKMIEAEQKGVLLKIEVMNTVSDVAMDKSDLIRGVGILLDNALDEAQSQEKSEVTLILLSEPEKFTVVVKNPIQKKPDLSKIWKQGYSTKGENRGLGLTSYKKILNKYANTSCETRVTNNTFLQVLLISNALCFETTDVVNILSRQKWRENL